MRLKKTFLTLLNKGYLPLFIFSFTFLLIGCKNNSGSEPESNAIARVRNTYLYEEDIRGLVSKETSREDSVKIIENYINSWVKETLLLLQAEENLPENKKDFSKQIEAYRRSLIIYEYEKALVAQQLDTNITFQEIENYYLENKEQYKLRENLYRVGYFTLRNNSPELDKARKWHKSSKEKDLNKLQDYCIQFATEFNLFNQKWMTSSQLLGKFKSLRNQNENLLTSQKYIELQDSTFINFFTVYEYKAKGEQTPVEIVQDNIRNYLINAKKIELINTMKKDIYNEALDKNQIEKFNSLSKK